VSDVVGGCGAARRRRFASAQQAGWPVAACSTGVLHIYLCRLILFDFLGVFDGALSGWGPSRPSHVFRCSAGLPRKRENEPEMPGFRIFAFDGGAPAIARRFRGRPRSLHIEHMPLVGLSGMPFPEARILALRVSGDAPYACDGGHQFAEHTR
jgi:hypothetical protein